MPNIAKNIAGYHPGLVSPSAAVGVIVNFNACLWYRPQYFSVEWKKSWCYNLFYREVCWKKLPSSLWSFCFLRITRVNVMPQISIANIFCRCSWVESNHQQSNRQPSTHPRTICNLTIAKTSCLLTICLHIICLQAIHLYKIWLQIAHLQTISLQSVSQSFYCAINTF